MRITRHLATVAVVAVAATSVIGFVSQSRVAAAVPSAEPALLWLEGELNDNGGSMPSSFDPTKTDWGLTIDTILALNGGGRGAEPAATTATEGLSANINDYITGEAFLDVGSHYSGPVGKSMLAAILQGANPSNFGGVDLEALSRAAIQPSGIHEGRFSDVSIFGDFSNGFGQALNILALSQTTAGVPASASDFLLAQQCPAGGFRLSYDPPFVLPPATPAPATRGCVSDSEADTDATAFALDALLTLDPGSVITAVDRAASWLVDHQDPVTHGFGGTGPTASVNANTTGLAVHASNAAGRAEAATRGLGYVRSLQLNPLQTSGTAAVGEEGAIARDEGALADALAGGITALARDQWRRATAQAVLAFNFPAFVAPRSDPVTLDPARLLDTRPGESTIDGLQLGGGLTPAGSTLVLQVTGRGGVPADAAAVVLNITAEGGQGPGFVSVYPCDAAQPLTSSLNFVTGTPTANAVVAGLSAAGTVCLYVGTNAVNLVADVNGYFPAASGYHPLTPARLMDSRPGESTIDGAQVGAGLTPAGSTLVLPISGRGGVPADVDAVVLNVTADGGEGPGFVTVYACDAPRPLASNLNFTASTPIANMVATELSTTGMVCLYVATNAVNLIADVNGYFPTGSGYNAVTPARLLDTRPGESTIDGAQLGAGLTGAGTTLVLPVAGRAGVPADAASVVLNVTADGALGTGFVTVYACDAPRPLASNLNFVANTPIPNAVITKLSAAGTVCLYVATNPVNLIADVSGYFG